ncbi:hypothetical protein V6N13_104628 [Hibiscus sabdariffa]
MFVLTLTLVSHGGGIGVLFRVECEVFSRTFIYDVNMILRCHGSSIRALENQVGQIAQALQVRPQGGLPSDTEVTKRNDKVQCRSLTLRSGTTINKDVEFGGEKSTEATPASTQKESELPDKMNEEEGKEGIQSTKPSGG